MREDEFDVCLEEAMDLLPEKFRQVLADVPIIVEDEPTDEILEGLEDPIEDDELLGLHAGSPAEEADLTGAEPSRIYLFRGPLLRSARNRRELAHEIRVTLLHEIGHHLGLEEADLERLGYD